MRRFHLALLSQCLLACVCLRGRALAQESIPAPVAEPIRALSLEQATAVALLNNPLLARARGDLEEARGLAMQAGLYPNPRYDGGNPHQLGGSQSLYNTGITQPWVRGGKLRLDVAAAERFVEQSQLDLVRQRFDLLTDVRNQFFTTLAAQERLQTIRGLLAIARQSLDASEKLLNAGQGTETDALLLRMEVRRVEGSVFTTESALIGGRRQLAAVIGVPEYPIEQLSGNLMVSLPEFDDTSTRTRLLAIHAGVMRSRIEVARNQILLRRAQAETTPNVDLQGGYQYTVSATHNQAIVAAYFDVPIWNRNQGNIFSARAGIREALAQSQALESDLLRALAESLGRYRSARQLVVALEQGVLPDARRTTRLVQRGYEEGEFDLVRLLRSQRTLFEANLAYIKALTDRLTSGAEVAGMLQLDQFP